MDTKALERFCPWARAELIEAVKTRCLRYGLDDAGRTAAPADSDIVAGQVLSSEEKNQRRALYPVIEEMGYKAFCEREAYSWFNRFVAIRFMELNGYLSNHVRMLSASDGSFDPECLRAVGEISLPGLERDTVLDLAAEGNDEELFRLILVAQCNELAQALPNIFGKVKEADALTLPDALTTPGEHNVLQHLVTDIPEVDENGERPWEHIEILGWMYQFYNAEVKAEFFKSKHKAEAKDIAPATQLFTPEWIVRYMVDNSLGRLWMLNFPDSRLRERAKEPNPDERLMEYYIEPDEEHEDFIRIAGPEEITFCDPACGSGHILVYAFKMLFAMYEERGYRSREIPELILTKNLSGMEIDERAAQIAELCLALCARKHDRRFFTRGVAADITVLKSIVFDEGELPETSALVSHRKQDLLDGLAHLSEIGSLLTVDEGELGCIRDDAVTISHVAASSANAFLGATAQKLEKARSACEALARRFDVVVANPPYMGSSRFNKDMSKWVAKRYPNVKSDLFSAFAIRIMGYTEPHGEIGMMTPYVWMFIGSYEKLRNKIIDEKTITSLVQLEYSGFAEATVPICTFTFHNSCIKGYRGGYIRLSDFVGASIQGPKALQAIQDPGCGYFYRTDATTFHDIPGSPIAYWASKAVHDIFTGYQPLSRNAKVFMGTTTGDNERFYRKWWEISQKYSVRTCENRNESIMLSGTWYPCNRGGDYRKWYGNLLDVCNWLHDGEAICAFPKSYPRNLDNNFKQGVTWNLITSGKISLRFLPSGCVIDQAGPAANISPDEARVLLANLNSSPLQHFIDLMNPSLNLPPGTMGLVPVATSRMLQGQRDIIESLASNNINRSIDDWNSREISWDFKRSPLI